MKFFVYISIMSKVVMYVFLCWIAIETVMFIGEHGLKELFMLIWEGKK